MAASASAVAAAFPSVEAAAGATVGRNPRADVADRRKAVPVQ
jgi:hypothetical protein